MILSGHYYFYPLESSILLITNNQLNDYFYDIEAIDYHTGAGIRFADNSTRAANLIYIGPTSEDVEQFILNHPEHFI